MGGTPQVDPAKMMPLDQSLAEAGQTIVYDEKGKPYRAYENLLKMSGDSFQQARTVVIVPTRSQFIHHRIHQSLTGLLPLMNQEKALFFVYGHEVGRAYTEAIQTILNHDKLKHFEYVLTVEDDNLLPPDAHVRLVEAIQLTRLDAVSGLYFTKGDWNAPMAYGNPVDYLQTGALDFRPFPPAVVLAAMQHQRIMPVNGIAMGCALWRMSLFREVPPPWFVSVSDVLDGAAQAFTQDLWFCKNAVLAGKRFGVDFRVKVGHMDLETGEVY